MKYGVKFLLECYCEVEADNEDQAFLMAQERDYNKIGSTVFDEEFTVFGEAFSHSSSEASTRQKGSKEAK